MKIIGADNLSEEEIALKITEGYRLVSYQYCLSFIVVTFRRTSAMFLLNKHEKGWSLALSYAAISFCFGWWGLPWGIIYTIQSLYKTLSGGTDHSQLLVQHVMDAPKPSVVAPPPAIPGVEKAPKTAIMSLSLGLLGFVLGPYTAIPAILNGHIALFEISRNSSGKGREMALAGLILGYVIAAAWLGFFIWLITTAFSQAQ